MKKYFTFSRSNDFAKKFFTTMLVIITNGRYPYHQMIDGYVNEFWEFPSNLGGSSITKLNSGVVAKRTLKPEIITWLEENAERYIIIEEIVSVYFYRKQDAVLFKMTWD